MEIFSCSLFRLSHWSCRRWRRSGIINGDRFEQGFRLIDNARPMNGGMPLKRNGVYRNRLPLLLYIEIAKVSNTNWLCSFYCQKNFGGSAENLFQNSHERSRSRWVITTSSGWQNVCGSLLSQLQVMFRFCMVLELLFWQAVNRIIDRRMRVKAGSGHWMDSDSSNVAKV